ncbi:MAG: hypothetical protein JWR64_953 [Marmoricola sp.]|jgi:hypothetical protein|nr:hypothetical protein [Marmoricola sp.]
MSGCSAALRNHYLCRAKYLLLGNVTTCTDTGLTPRTRYTYKVYASDAPATGAAATGDLSVVAR